MAAPQPAFNRRCVLHRNDETGATSLFDTPGAEVGSPSA